jgi:hypothetical protein
LTSVKCWSISVACGAETHMTRCAMEVGRSASQSSNHTLVRYKPDK